MEALKITPNSNKYRKFSTGMTVLQYFVQIHGHRTHDFPLSLIKITLN